MSIFNPKLPFHVMVKPRGPICNLDCAYCYYLHKENLYPAGEDFHISDACLETFIRDYIASQPGPEVVLSWQGGEPTLIGLDFFKRSIELQRKYLPAGWTCTHSLQTNATLLNDEWCRFFKQHHFLIGVSVDGPETIHDHYRRDKGGNSTHAGVMEGIRLLQKHQVDFNILCVVNNVNAEHPLDVYRFFKDLGATWIQFIPIVEREGDGVSNRSVSPAAFGRFLTTIFAEWVRHDIGRIFVQMFEEAVAVWAGYPASLCVYKNTCGRALVLEHNGDLYSCDHFVDPPYRLGNIMERNLAEMVDSEQQRRFGRDKHDKLPRYCRQCDYLFICQGACPKDRISRTPSGEPGLNYLCEGYKSFFRYADPYLQRIAQHIRNRRPAALLMDELRRETAQAMADAGRNDPCPCGSGLKYKKCCMGKK